MKKIIIALLITFMAVSGSFSQSLDNVTFSNVKIARYGGNIKINFEITPKKKAVKSNYKMTLTPCIYNEGKRIDLPIIEIKGYLYERRERQVALLNKVIIINKFTAKEGMQSNYFAQIPYDESMKNIKLVISQKIEGCCDSYIAGDKLIGFTYLEPIVDHKRTIEPTIKPATVKKEMIIYFPLSKYNINRELMLNKDILEVVNSIAQNNNIEITGYASPEGNIAINNKLAIKRAIVLKNYIMSVIPTLSNSSFKIINGGINWSALKNMVSKSNMLNKNKVINIINNSPKNIRLSRLKSLDDGSSYSYMLKELFPKLRYSYCKVIESNKQ